MTRRTVATTLVIALVSLTPSVARAQLAAPAASGVVMGHLHLMSRDVEAQKRFWAALGGTPVQNGNLQLIQFPGTYVMVRQAEPTGGTAGTVVNHVGFLVKDLQGWTTKWRDAAMKIETTARPDQIYLLAPDDIRVEITEDKSIDVPLKMHHVHFYMMVPTDAQAWYAKTFGAAPGKRGQHAAADLPGVNLTFTKAEAALAPTKGRSLDHIGFEVKNLEQFCKDLEAAGMKLDRPYTKLPNSTTAIAFLTDPWGAYVELTENLAPQP